MKPQLSIIIPIYNEVETLEALVERVQAAPFDKEIILVDDFSTDGTREKARQLESAENVRLFLHEKNQGKGAALKTGFAQHRGEIVIIQDADMEYDPAEYTRLVQPILDDRADVVYGSRFVGGRSRRVLFFWHMIGNRFLTLLSNMFTNLNLTNMETCYKVFRSEILKRITIKEDRFGFEPEITAKIAKLNCRVYEVGISYSGRTYQEGKKIGWRDGMSALRCILRYNIFG